MDLTRITRMSTTLVAAAFLSVTLVGCGGGGSGGNDASAGASSDAGTAAGSDAATGKTFCEAIKAVQADLHPDAKSAAYLAQLTLKLDPEKTSKLSAAAVDKATKGQCPTEYQKFLGQAQITSLRDVGLQP